MNPLKVLFFGSTSDSVLVLEKLANLPPISDFQLLVSGTVTQPPRPVGRRQVLTPTPVETWAKEHNIPVLSFPNHPDYPYLFANEEQVIASLEPFKTDLVISASYGQKIPMAIISKARFRGLNIHPSLLPRWRGADPVPWAILSGDAQTGVTIVTLEEKFDAGRIIAQKKVPITKKDFSDSLRSRLFTLGATLLVEILPDYLAGKNKGKPQMSGGPAKEPYARRLTRKDGFEKWEVINEAMETGQDAERLNRNFRAFSPWPGLWTTLKIQGQEKRLKILQLATSNQRLTLETVQLEGKKPVSFREFSRGYLAS